VLKAGESKYTVTIDGTVYWGQWSGAAVDPANDTDLWTVQEYASAPVSGVDHWGTWWGRIPPIRNLVLSMSHAPDPVIAGSNVTYSITFTNVNLNDGIQDVPAVRVMDTLPAGSVFVSATPSQGSCGVTNGVVTCDFGTLAEGSTGRVSIVATLMN